MRCKAGTGQDDRAYNGQVSVSACEHALVRLLTRHMDGDIFLTVCIVLHRYAGFGSAWGLDFAASHRNKSSLEESPSVYVDIQGTAKK